ncbi:Outer membrane usher protein FimD/PapC [Erythrobacter litoralis]|nr:Outer membrane usher protein FimD/PapC [Erythrobacter litoralis]
MVHLPARQADEQENNADREWQMASALPAAPSLLVSFSRSDSASALGESIAAEVVRPESPLEPLSVSIAPALNIDSRLPMLIDEQLAGLLDVRQTLDGLSIRVGSLADLLKDRFSASEWARFENANALDLYLSLPQLRETGIPIAYDPVRDAFELGEPASTVAPAFALEATTLAARDEPGGVVSDGVLFSLDAPLTLGVETAPGAVVASLAEEVVPILPTFDVANGASEHVQLSTPLSLINVASISQDAVSDPVPGLIPSRPAASTASDAAARMVHLPARQADEQENNADREWQMASALPAAPSLLVSFSRSDSASALGESIAAEVVRPESPLEPLSVSIAPALNIDSRLPMLIAEQLAGLLDVRQTLDGLSIRVGSLADLLKDRFSASEWARFENANALDLYLSLPQLRETGIPIAYDPVRDAFELGEPASTVAPAFALEVPSLNASVDALPSHSAPALGEAIAVSASTAQDLGAPTVLSREQSHAASEVEFVPKRFHDDEVPFASFVVDQGSPQPVVASGSPPQPDLSPAAERAVVINVPLATEGATLGNIRAEINSTHVLKASATDVAEVLGSLVDDITRDRLLGLGPDLVPVDRLREIGLDITFVPSTLSLSVDIPLASRGTQVLSGSRQIDFSGMPAALPSNFSAGVTLSSFTTGDIVAMERVSSNLLVNGFTNVGGIEGVNLLFGGQFDFTGNENFFIRDRIIAFKDDTDNVLRYSGGDILPLQSRYGSDFDLLGIGVQRFYQDLQPNRNVRPLGSRSFLLERPALIEIYVNGALLRTFSAGPGPIDIRDIPVSDLSNQVTIVIEDALGRREVDSFTLGNDVNLLSDGLNEFSFAVGMLRDNRVVGFSYTSDPVASLFYRQGVTESLTLSGSAVITQDYQNIGFSAAFAAFRGVTQIDIAASNSNVGEGAVVALNYRGTPIDLGFGGAQTNLRAEYRTPQFQTLASFGFLEDIEFDLAADVRANISPTSQAVFGATYFSTHRTDEERYGLFGGLQKQLGRFNLGVNLRYSEFNSRSEFGALVTAAVQLGRRSNIFATVDTASQTARVEYRQLRPLTLPEVEYGARAQYGPDSYEIGGRFGYGTSRFEALVDIQQEYDRAESDFRNQSSVRLQTGIGFTDGTFGIGRDPSRGFIMVKKHPSLEDAQVRVSTGAVGRDLGFADSLGPAVVPVFIPYRPQEIRVSTENAPVGYNIGAGEYVAMPGARTGIAVTVGSDDYRIATATLTGFDNKRVGLTTGRLIDLENGKTRTFFTNRTGRAVFTQLAPGRYRAEIDGTDLQFEFEVREDDPANISLGNIELRSGK